MTTPSKPSPHSPGPWGWGEYDDQDLVNDDKLCQQNGYPMGFYDESGMRGDPTHEANRALIAKAPELAAMLRELEWSGCDFDDRNRAYQACPVCKARTNAHNAVTGKPPEPHTPDCRLAALLRDLP